MDEGLLVLQTGGTIDKDYPRTTGGYAFEIHDPATARILTTARPSFESRTVTICKKDSTDLNKHDREQLLQICRAAPEKKILITHGSDTMIETAKFLEGKLPAGKIAVITGALLPERFKGSDADFNVGLAVGALNVLGGEGTPKAQVWIAMSGRLMASYQVSRDQVSGLFMPKGSKHSKNAPLPKEIVDAHHHFFDPESNKTFQNFLGALGVPMYTPEQYKADVGHLNVTHSVHVEALPDLGCGAAEVKWVESLRSKCQVGAIVAACNLADSNADEQLRLITSSSNIVRGIRFILDYDGKFSKEDLNGTHVSISRLGVDYLRDPVEAPKFAKGFALLSKYNLSFDLQCAPVQLKAAAQLCQAHPDVRLVIDHMGKPRHLAVNGFDAGGKLLPEDIKSLSLWRDGMAAMAKCPNVFVKLSMLGYAVPQWVQDPKREHLLRSLVRETIDLFGARRCMFASNWHVNGMVSNGDSMREEDSIEMIQLYQRYSNWVADYSPADRTMLFAGTAKVFYRLSTVP